jgi:transposase
VEQILAHTLRPGQLVIMDNLSVHHRARVQQLIRARECQVWFFLSYSLDLSPIEPAFAKLKQAWRKAEARTTEALYDTIGASLPMITPEDARSFFADCGYQVPRHA